MFGFLFRGSSAKAKEPEKASDQTQQEQPTSSKRDGQAILGTIFKKRQPENAVQYTLEPESVAVNEAPVAAYPSYPSKRWIRDPTYFPEPITMPEETGNEKKAINRKKFQSCDTCPPTHRFMTRSKDYIPSIPCVCKEKKNKLF